MYVPSPLYGFGWMNSNANAGKWDSELNKDDKIMKELFLLQTVFHCKSHVRYSIGLHYILGIIWLLTISGQIYRLISNALEEDVVTDFC